MGPSPDLTLLITSRGNLYEKGAKDMAEYCCLFVAFQYFRTEKGAELENHFILMT